MPDSERIVSEASFVMTLCISACEPTRIVMMLRVEAVTESVRETPCHKASTKRKTVTTRQTTKMVIRVETFLTKRLRRLYFSGMAISLDDLPQPIHDLDL